MPDMDFSAWEEPDPNIEPREFLKSCLHYQHHEFTRKLRDLSAEHFHQLERPLWLPFGTGLRSRVRTFRDRPKRRMRLEDTS